MTSTPFLSKSKYLNGLQCSKLLWYYYHAKEEIPPADASTQAVFDQGHVVGEYARKLFPDGIEVAAGTVDFAEVVKQTRALIPEGRPLFEAAFMSDGCYARADILVPAGEITAVRHSGPAARRHRDMKATESRNQFDKNARHSGQAASDLHSAAMSRNLSSPFQWDIIEVKSSTQVKEVNLHDLSLQWYTYAAAGLPLRRCYLMHINNQYVRKGEIDVRQLFTKEDVTDAVQALLPKVKERLDAMQSIIALRRSPDVPIGPHCSSPYDCPMTEVCWKHLPAHNPATLHGIRQKAAFELIDQGVTDLRKLPSSVKLTGKQRIQVRSIMTKKPYVDAKSIRSFLDKLVYPLYYLDFETFNSAVPLFDECRPFQQIPFQFSLHIQDSPDAAPRREGYLHDGPTDPRPEFMKRLKEVLGTKGSIVTYNASFEKGRLKEVAEFLPEYEGWNTRIQKRIVDLLDPFRAFSYYHYSQMGSASIKQVLPAMTGKGYEGLEIADGGVASQEYLRVTFGEGITEKERSKVRSELEQYCALDTEGMMWIVNDLSKQGNA